MENKCKCKICGKETTNNNSYIGSHVKRIHKLKLIEYVEKYYTLNNNFKIEKCGFCENNAEPSYIIDHTGYTYIKNYDNGYICNTKECRNNISFEILGIEYDTKKYEHIGSKSEYLSKLYKIDLFEAKNMKTDNHKCLEKSKTDLNGYILRYGTETGKIRYKERCDKISKCSSKLYYIENYGEIEGIIKWDLYISKLKNKTLGTTKSKSSLRVLNMLTELNIETIVEKPFNNGQVRKNVDFYLPLYNIVIEYFGDYWHMNPRLYENIFFNKTLKMTAEDVWIKDKKRNEEVKTCIKDCSLIIIWETTKITKEYLLDIINQMKDKKTTIYL